MDGWTYEDLTLRSQVGLHVRWPRMTAINAWWMEESRRKQIAERNERIEALHDAFQNGRNYLHALQGTEEAPRDSRWESLIPVLQGTIPVIVHADSTRQIQAAVAFSRRHNVQMIILGGYDAVECAELLIRNRIPVIIQGVHRLPLRRSDDYDAAYTLPERLRQAGVTYCIAGAGRFDASNIRNLPYQAATAVAYGLPADEAIKAITLYPAQILGVQDRVGSLEPGKDATIIVTNGDPLETPTAVESAFIQGRSVDLSNRHKRLWKKYQRKYQQIEERRSH